MKFILQVFGIMILGHMFEIFLPWYSIALAAFVMGYFLRSRANFLAGFLGIALLWLFQAWMMNSGTASDLAGRVAHIFSLSRTEWLLLVMALVGGMVGGFAALSGALLKPKHRTYS